MLDTILLFLQTGDIELIRPFLNQVIASRVSQELFVWGIIYVVVRKDVKKTLISARKELEHTVQVAKDELTTKVTGIETAITKLTETIGNVEKQHFSENRETNKRLDRHGEVQKEFATSQKTHETMLTKVLEKIRTIEIKLGLSTPDKELEA